MASKPQRQSQHRQQGIGHHRQQAAEGRAPCYTLKRPYVFQLRKSLVEYVDEELLGMNTSVFYQRIFILAKNVDPLKESAIAAKLAAEAAAGTAAQSSGEPPRAAEVHEGEDDEQQQQHYSQPSTPEEKTENGADDAGKVDDPNVETLTRTFKFNLEKEVTVDADEEEFETEPEPEPVIDAEPKDAFAHFIGKLEELQETSRQLSYSPDPMCGLLVYMNDYTMLMLESGEDMMGIFCGQLLDCIDSYWQDNRVVVIEDHIHDLYTKNLIYRRIPAAFLNEKFPTSTPTDEYLMGKQHLIIKEKMHTICALVRDSLDPKLIPTEISITSAHTLSVAEEEFGEEESDEERPTERTTGRLTLGSQRGGSTTNSLALPPAIYRKHLPEIPRIEMVLAATRFYYTLAEFVALYGKVPLGRDDDAFYWPIQNNYAPPHIFRRTPFDINLSFADYAAEMKRRMEEEQAKLLAEQEAAAAAQAQLEQQQQQQQMPTKHKESVGDK